MILINIRISFPSIQLKGLTFNVKYDIQQKNVKPFFQKNGHETKKGGRDELIQNGHLVKSKSRLRYLTLING